MAGGIMLFNSLTLTSSLNLLLSLPQLVIVLFYIATGRLKEATMLHIFFLITSFSATSGLDLSTSISNYSRLKIFGNIGLHHVLAIIIALLSLKNSQRLHLSYFDRCFSIFLVLGISAILIGLFGLLFSDYNFSYFISRIIYISTLVLYMYILKRNSDIEFLRTAFKMSIALLVVAPIVSYISYYLGVSVKYSVYNIPISSDIVYFVPILFLGFFYFKKNVLVFISLTIYLFLLSQGGRGGMFLILIFVFCFLFYQAFFSIDIRARYFQKVKILRTIILFILAALIFGVFSINYEGLAVHKISHVMSLFNFLGSFDINQVGSSPYVRMAEVLNVVNDTNFFTLFFGKGYGGYYTDELSLFTKVDLFSGGFEESVVLSGKYPIAHGSIPSTLLYNGLIGLFFVVYLGFLSLKRMSNSFLAFSGVILFFYSFYFNHLMGTIAVFFIFASDLNLNNEENSYENIIHR